METILELKEYLSNLRKGDYQMDNFDDFLHKVKFSFTIPAIHIAGTNGKGTTSKIINDVYVKHGYKVGLFNSPYYYSPLEMINVNNVNIPLEDFIDIVNENKKLIDKYNLSEFEVETFVMFEYFKKVNVDIAIIECGMGGEDDATNVFKPILSIITSVGLEHTEFLGSSITEIAQAKAGIIKEEVPILIGPMNDDALEVIKEVARDNNTNITQNHSYLFEKLEDDGYSFTFKPYDNLKIHYFSLFSLLDASISLTAVEMLNERFPVLESDIRSALEEFKLPGRMEVVLNKPLVIIDGGHNPHGIAALRESLEKIQNDRPIHVIFASFRDKNIERMFAELSFISKDITITTFDHPRARKEEEYFLFLDEYKFEEDPFKLIMTKIKQYPDDIIVITGSLAFALLVSDYFKRGLIHYE